ncbi:MAG: hypothetical protein QOJ65_601 [Fimbriimonadaceae bacterium]|nr:hypothetical protein [Fimbriimonadaceae bacterium]
MTRRLRLLKVIVQPIFVIDENQEALSELDVRPIEVSAQDWPAFASIGFSQAIEILRREVEGSGGD